MTADLYQQINSTVKLTKIDEKAIKTILAGYKIHNCDVSRLINLRILMFMGAQVMIREDVCMLFASVAISDTNFQISDDELIDVLIGTRKYIPCLYVFNKIDAISLEQLDKYARQDHSMVISCEMGLKQGFTQVSWLETDVEFSLDILVEKIWEVRLSQ